MKILENPHATLFYFMSVWVFIKIGKSIDFWQTKVYYILMADKSEVMRCHEEDGQANR